MTSSGLSRRRASRKKRLSEEWAPLFAPSAAPALRHASFIDMEVPLRRCSIIDFTVGRPCDPCDEDLIIVEQENLEALSRGTDFSPDEAWADAVAAMGPARARMFSSDADVEPVPGLGFGLGVD